ncbi:anthranilate synthase component II [Mesonia maritima]|uniref:Anthranilate synthase component 2 n=1 Tax=Mesonia maritima TaxID=1793873 RepID=A0ABU1K6K3_9FLAO|nr:aminodeoxychorismate/anthranilate synthase component II [Mesonia maritima]MDR6301231.1 anthranilate synthase component 2 [Mesonia maritima]
MEEILVIDNYDSFVYNLVHYLEAFDKHVTVVRNDKISLDDIEDFQKIILSPGPGVPRETKNLISIIKKYGATKSILGVCLGQQAIAEAYGGKLENLESVYHGVASRLHVKVSDEELFKNLPAQFSVGRYHSWVASQKLPDCLEVTATDENGIVMALRHRFFDVKGVQFHPESILTEFGKELIENWLTSTSVKKQVL